MPLSERRVLIQNGRTERRETQHIFSIGNQWEENISIKVDYSLFLYLFFLGVYCCILLYLAVLLPLLPAQPCGWCIRTLRVGRHHPRRLDLSLSLSLSLDTLPHSTEYHGLVLFSLSSPSSPLKYSSPVLIILSGVPAFVYLVRPES